MTGQSVAIRPFVDQIQARPRLQRGWEVSLAVGFTGFVLLASRLLGSLPADSDAVRGVGFLCLVNGCCLASWLGLKAFTRSETESLPHHACWAGLIFLGAVQTSIALLPLQSFVAVTGGLVSLLLLAGFALHDLLNAPGLAFSRLPEEPVAPVDQNDWQPEPGEQETVVADLSKDGALRAGSEDLTQWLTRKRLDDGGEEVEGMIRLELAVGQTQRSAHVTFSPALAVTPEIECEPLSDVDVEATVGDVYPHGFRVDVRRGRAASEAALVEIGFQAIAIADSKPNAA